MPDQDEFAPLARRWTAAHEMVLLDKSAVEIADAAFRTLREMLRDCGGCALLTELVGQLGHFAAITSQRPALGWMVGGEAERALAETLDRIARDLDNRRIDAVAVRSCRIAAIEIAHGRFPRNVGTAFATLVATHLLCHFVLDRTRAMTITSHLEPYPRQVQAQILEILAPHLERFGERWIHEPDAQFAMRLRRKSRMGTADILAREDEFSLD